jgi:hypothetical protein
VLEHLGSIRLDEAEVGMPARSASSIVRQPRAEHLDGEEVALGRGGRGVTIACPWPDPISTVRAPRVRTPGGHDRGPRTDAGGRGVALHVDDVLRGQLRPARSCASLIRPLRRTNETGLSRKREHLSRAASDQAPAGTLQGDDGLTR